MILKQLKSRIYELRQIYELGSNEIRVYLNITSNFAIFSKCLVTYLNPQYLILKKPSSKKHNF